MKLRNSLILLPVVAWAAVGASELNGLNNYLAYSPVLASSGQPTEAQLRTIRSAGYERIVYLAYTDHDRSLPNEDRLVSELGMTYLQIPVDWENPQRDTFYLFAGALAQQPGRKTLVHCQVNYRASAYSFLYRVVYGGVDLAEAKRDMNAVWEPNAAWTRYIFDILAENGISPHCEGCRWASAAE